MAQVLPHLYCHFERGCMSVLAANGLCPIDTLSREISRRHEACTISEWDFSTSLRSGRNDRDGGLPTVIHSKYGHSKKRGNEVPRFFDVPISSRRRGGGGK